MKIAVLVGEVVYETQKRLLDGIIKYADVFFARDTLQDEKSASAITQKIVDSGVRTVSIENYISGMSVFYTDNRTAMEDLNLGFEEYGRQ